MQNLVVPNIEGFKKFKALLDKNRIFGKLSTRELVNISLVEKGANLNIDLMDQSNKWLYELNAINTAYFGLTKLGLKYNFAANIHEKTEK